MPYLCDPKGKENFALLFGVELNGKKVLTTWEWFKVKPGVQTVTLFGKISNWSADDVRGANGLTLSDHPFIQFEVHGSTYKAKDKDKKEVEVTPSESELALYNRLIALDSSLFYSGEFIIGDISTDLELINDLDYPEPKRLLKLASIWQVTEADKPDGYETLKEPSGSGGRSYSAKSELDKSKERLVAINYWLEQSGLGKVESLNDLINLTTDSKTGAPNAIHYALMLVLS